MIFIENWAPLRITKNLINAKLMLIEKPTKSFLNLLRWRRLNICTSQYNISTTIHLIAFFWLSSEAYILRLQYIHVENTRTTEDFNSYVLHHISFFDAECITGENLFIQQNYWIEKHFINQKI